MKHYDTRWNGKKHPTKYHVYKTKVAKNQKSGMNLKVTTNGGCMLVAWEIERIAMQPNMLMKCHKISLFSGELLVIDINYNEVYSRNCFTK